MPRAKAGSAASGSKKPRAPKGPKLPDPFDNGTILQDLRKKQWQLGTEIGQGGFGLIYSASDDITAPVEKTSPYVIKIEPQANGPLFCELHFYQRVAKSDAITDFTRSKKLKYLGVPKFIASGSHTRGKDTFRFMVMPRFGSDIQKIFETAGKKFDKCTVYSLALRVLDSLEFIHDNGYVHADIKASNLLLGFNGGKVQTDQVYLVDYGLAYRYSPEGVHKEYKEDPRKCHDGTIEFTSLDAHKGVVPARRGDLGILGFCLLQWLCSRLPWEDKLLDKSYVRDCKIKYMNDIPSLMKKCFPDGNIPDEIVKYLTMVMKLKYEEKPDYNKLRSIFKDGLKKCGWKDEWKLGLPLSGPSTVPKKGTKRKSEVALDDEGPVSTPKRSAKAGLVAKNKSTPRTPNVITSPKQQGKITPSTSKLPATRTGKRQTVGSPVVNNHVTSPRKAVTSPQRGKKSVTSPATSKKVSSPRKTVVSPRKQVNKSTTPKASTRRKVKRSKAPKVDACIQTSPPPT